MSHARTRTRKAFPIALLVTVVVALLPGRWLAKLSDLGTIVNVPLIPLRHGADLLADVFRPVPVVMEEHLADATRDQLYSESRAWRQRFLQASLEIKRLEDELDHYRLFPAERFGPTSVKPLPARITGRNPAAPRDALELNCGSRQRVVPRTVAVKDGIYLVGLVQDVTPVRSVLVPVTAPATGYVSARIGAADAVEQGIDGAPAINLKPLGDGTLAGDVSRDVPVAEGDRVWLSDPDWPDTAQAMIIGSVHSIRVNDEQPLRNTVIVRPFHEPHQLSSVTLVVELAEESAAADEKEPTS